MCLFIASLNSGSNGNCYYIGSEDDAILVDAGISCGQTEKRMKRLGLAMEKVKAIFVSHEHKDHITGIPVLAKKYRIPVYITENTRCHVRLVPDKHQVVSFSAYVPVQIGSLTVTAFPKFHDACDPHSFIVTSRSVKVGIFTDIGFACEHVINHFKQCHAAFLEANYDEEMLNNGRYPYYLKKRISGSNGHLSNTQALKLVMTYKPSFMSHLLLSHLSQNNNCPKLVHELFSKHVRDTKIIVASRFEESQVYPINSETMLGGSLKLRNRKPVQLQLSLF